MARKRRRNELVVAEKTQAPTSSGIMSLRYLPVQKYFFDAVAPAQAKLIFYALQAEHGFTDHEVDIKLDGAVLLDCGDTTLQAQRVVALYVEPRNPDSHRLEVMTCADEIFESERDSVERLRGLKPPVLHSSYDRGYAEHTWRTLAGPLSRNRAPMVFVIVATPAFGDQQDPDVRIWVPCSPRRLSLGYGLTRLQAALG